MKTAASRIVGLLLNKIMHWALAKNGPGGYRGEDDTRWAYVIETDGDQYLERLLLPRIRVPALGIDVKPMIHHFLRPDADRNLHDHPWAWARSLVLSGSYVETRLERDETTLSRAAGGQDVTVTREVRRHNALDAGDFHKVDELLGDVWTLFITGPTVQDWGFRVGGRKIPWRQYLADRGRS